MANKFKLDKGKLQFLVVAAFVLGAVVVSQMTGGDGEAVSSVGSSENSILVESTKLSPQELPLEYETTGTVRVRNYVDTVPQVSGRVTWVNSVFREGGVFKENEVLFRVEQEDFKLMVAQAQAEVNKAKTNLSLEEAESKAASEEWKILNPDDPIPNLVARKPQMEQSKAELLSARAKLRDAELDLYRTGYRLSYSGRVVSSTVEVGQYIQSGQGYGQVYSLDALEVVVPISDDKLKWFDAQNAKVTFKTIYMGEEIEVDGKIARISNVLDNETRFANIIVTPAGKKWEVIIPGIFVDVELEAQKISNIWKIPNTALQENKSLWVVSSDRTISRLNPEIIFVNDDYTLAKSNGTDIEIIVGSLEGANEGMKVRLVGE